MSYLRRTIAVGASWCALAAVALANSATTPTARDEACMRRHEEFLQIGRSERIDILFIGDSITDFWRDGNKARGGKAVWDASFAALHVANFGIGADRTQHVLWRIEHGELDGLKPKVVALLIGTNNANLAIDPVNPHNTAAETVEGISLVVKSIRLKLPASKILLLALFPRGEKSDPMRQRIKEVNAALAALDDGRFVLFLDFSDKFLEPDGTLSRTMMPDLLHPSEKGYQ